MALLQLATVTWLPVIHPIIHPDAPPPSEVNAIVDPSGDQDRVSGVATFCFICAAGRELSATTDHKFPLGDIASWRLPLSCAEQLTSPLTDTPANPARAPPSY